MEIRASRAVPTRSGHVSGPPSETDRARNRTSVGVTTANAPAMAAPCTRTASETIAAFLSGGNPAKRTSNTPLCACPRRYTSSPKSLSAVTRTALSRAARARTVSSDAPGSSSQTHAVAWPSSRKRRAMDASTLSSTKNLTCVPRSRDTRHPRGVPSRHSPGPREWPRA